MSLKPTQVDSKSVAIHSVNPNAIGQTKPSSPRTLLSLDLPSDCQRKIAIAIDLSDESAYTVGWAVQNYLRPRDLVFFLHVRPTSIFYGADWGSIGLSQRKSGCEGVCDEESQRKLENDFDNHTTAKANELAQPLVEANIPFKIHVVKDHDMKERLCLEVERLGLNVVIMGSRGIGSSKRISKSRLGSVSNYCVHHCVCPVVVVRYPDDRNVSSGGDADNDGSASGSMKSTFGEDAELDPVPEDEQEYHDADEEVKEIVQVAEVEKTAE